MIYKFIPVVPGRVMQRLIRSMGAVINLEDLELLADRLTNGIVAISPYIVRGFKGQETLQLLETLEYRLGGDGAKCQMSRCDPNARAERLIRSMGAGTMVVLDLEDGYLDVRDLGLAG